MAFQDVAGRIEGFTELQREVEERRKHGRVAYQAGEARRVIERLHPARLALELATVLTETPSAKTFRLVPVSGRLPLFRAGQYVNLFVEVDGVHTSRPFSISSPPTQTGHYDLTVRRAPGGFVSDYLLDRARVGDCFESTGPVGDFTYNPLFHGSALVFLAGGSGITPFMSMIREIADRGLKRRVHLLYGSRTPDDVIFREELGEIARRHSGIVVDTVISEPPPGYEGRTGLLSVECIRECIGEPGGRMFYVCGPQAMYSYCREALASLGIPRRRVRTEVFGPPRDITCEPGWPATVAADARFTVTLAGGKQIPARAGEPLLISLEREGITLPAQCRSGDCSLCRVRLVGGRVYQTMEARLRSSDRRFGYIHACSAYPLSDVALEVRPS